MYSKILVIATRRIGDVLLTTPLFHALKRSYPNAKINVIVLQGTAGILEGNSDVDEVIEISERPTKAEYKEIIRKIWRKYDLSISSLPGDKPVLLAWAGSKYRIGILHSLARKHLWKRWVLSKWALLNDQKWHVVMQNKQLTDLLGVRPSFTVVPPKAKNSQKVLEQYLSDKLSKGTFCVIHPQPMLRYKELCRGLWVDLGNYFLEQGISVVITGGPDTKEVELCEWISHQIQGAICLAGKLRFSDLSLLLQQSQYFVGPDTSITHLASACGVRTLAIFGPTSPVRWGPWPVGEAVKEEFSPYKKVGELQQFGNVSVYQPPRHCIPCQEEGCDKHQNSDSLCLKEINIKDLINYLPKPLVQ